MGMFDTIHFERSFACASCGTPLHEVQTKAFGCGLRDFVRGSCIDGPSSMRIVEEDLHCSQCTGKAGKVFFVVWRGILVGTTRNLPEATRKLADFGIEALTLIHYDTQRHLDRLTKEAWKHRHFLEALLRRLKGDMDPEQAWLDAFHETFREGESPADAAERFLAEHSLPLRLSVTEVDRL